MVKKFFFFKALSLGKGLYYVAVSIVLGLFIYLINQSRLFSVELMILIHMSSSLSPNEVLTPSFFCACIILEMCVRQMNAYFATKNINSNCIYYSKYLGYSRHYRYSFLTSLRFGVHNFIVDCFLSGCIFLEL